MAPKFRGFFVFGENMRKSEDIYFKDDNGERRFQVTALSAVQGFLLMQEGLLLLVKAGFLESMGINGDLNKAATAAAANFSLEALQRANLKAEDLFKFENSLLKSVTYVSPNGALTSINLDNADNYCQDPIEITKLLIAAFKVNFGFLKNAVQSISQPSQREQVGKQAEQAKPTSKRPTFQMR